jgi:hypothetical protein
MQKIGLLLISTSKGRNWITIKESYLYNIFIKSFLLTLNKEHNYVVYIGIDQGDTLLDNISNMNIITNFSKVFKNVEFKFIKFDKTVEKGHVTKMWNIVFKTAYDEMCDYFYQCGDDIEFKTNGWVNDSISVLKKNNDIGLSGPLNNNNRILTQSFVSRKHMEIFGWFFPEEIKNWCCDDWYNYVYQPDYFFPLKNHFCSNNGGTPRYEINNNSKFRDDFQNNLIKLRADTLELAQKHKELIKKYINQ